MPEGEVGLVAGVQDVQSLFEADTPAHHDLFDYPTLLCGDSSSYVRPEM